MATTTEPLPNDKDQNNDTNATNNGARKRTRATPEQLAVLEDTFAANVSPNSKLRKQLSERLQMSERSIQIWFQNRRAKVKHMQKRAQMQMQQASIRAQLYHYHQQQYGMQPPPPPPYGTPPIMPLPPQSASPSTPPPPSATAMYPQPPRVPLPRHSIDSPMATPPALTTSSSTSSISSASSLDSLANNIPNSSSLAYPLQDMVNFPDYLQGPLSPSPSPHPECPASMSSIPALVPVPDAGPTAMLATPSQASMPGLLPTDDILSSDSLIATPVSIMDHPMTVRPQDIWPHHGMRSQSVSMATIHSTPGSSEPSHHHFDRALSDPPVATIDPSNLLMNPSSQPLPTPSQDNTTSHDTHPPTPTPSSHPEYDVYLNCTTLTIGTWHRLKLRASDLVCVLNGKNFEWHIEDAGCHFKMEIPLSSVASIEYMEDANGLADVHFDISESPSFYMETTNEKTKTHAWIQCSDFTEGKQASRFFRHTLKGVAHQIKQDLMILMDKYPDTHRLIRFLDQAYYPSPSASAYYPADSSNLMLPSSYMSMANANPYWNSVCQVPPQPTMLMTGAPSYPV
ncbi:homeobox-domain-containing protein [Hesseltinella vesiculosa]|uniref:Homeobox-domain-containing protein n=1 Tax=Hesseltinella vesiculosa TaxID=101127 RepID=A0A1X2GWD3_9FUNG|nr:homeobox-domain-containing protein [Hesseltinella vesiculosa]